jgi:hypothetical protein
MLAAAVAVSTNDIEKILNQTSHMTDNEFVMYITWTMELYVSNPSQCAYITGITE